MTEHRREDAAAWEPPEWLVQALTDAMLGGENPEFITATEVRSSGVLHAMHDLGVRFSMEGSDV